MTRKVTCPACGKVGVRLWENGRMFKHDAHDASVAVSIDMVGGECPASGKKYRDAYVVIHGEPPVEERRRNASARRGKPLRRDENPDK